MIMNIKHVRFGVFMVFWVVIPCSDVAGYQPFRGPCYLHLQGEDEGTLQKLVSYHIITGHQNPEDVT